MKYIYRKKNKLSVVLKLSMAGALLLALLIPVLLFFLPANKEKDPPLQFSQELKMPDCSLESGFYENDLTVKLSAASGQRIFYSLDGNEPTLLSKEYKEPILISKKQNVSNELSAIPTSPRWKPPIDDVFKGTVLRAILVDEKNRKSTELIRTFFIDEKGKARYSLPVFSITANKKDLFGYNNGIYVLGKNYGDKNHYAKENIPLNLPWWEYPSNYLEKGEDSERPVNIEFFDDNGKGFVAKAGLRIHGNATRGFAQKSLRISFREKYGQDAIDYPLYHKDSLKRIRSFILRNSGNDWDKTMFRDAFMQTLMENSHLDVQEYRPSIVFINGEYWGIHNIRERFDEDYLVNKYSVSKDSICILEMSGSLVYGKKGDEKAFKRILDFIKNKDLSDKSNYEFICSKIDIESFCDFLIANIYFCNSDWPNNNVKFWRYKSDSADSSAIKDGKWRWMLYDTDWGFGYNSLSTPDNNLLGKARTTGSVGVLFNGLLQNNEFRDKFIARFQEHLNTTFYPPHVISLIDEMQQSLAPEMQEHIDRWRVIGSYRQWMSNVEVLRDYARKRPAFQVKYLNDFFDLPEGKRLLERK